MPLADPLRGLDSVHPGHSDVEKHELRREIRDGVERLLAGCRAADPVEARRCRDHVAGDVEKDRLVVDREYSDPVLGGRTHPRGRYGRTAPRASSDRGDLTIGARDGAASSPPEAEVNRTGRRRPTPLYRAPSAARLPDRGPGPDGTRQRPELASGRRSACCVGAPGGPRRTRSAATQESTASAPSHARAT